MILLCDNLFQVPVEGLDDIVVSLFNYCGVVSHFDIDETCLRVLIGRLRAEYVITNIGYIYIYILLPNWEAAGRVRVTLYIIPWVY